MVKFNSMDNQILYASLGAVVGAIITGIIAPYILQSSARKEARANALRCLMDVELTRWAGTPHKEYRKNQIELKAAVLVANGSRSIADSYSKMAAIARSYSDLDVEDHYFDGEGGIPINVAELVNDAAALLSVSLWTPLIIRPALMLRLRDLHKKQDAMRSEYKGERGEECWKIRTI